MALASSTVFEIRSTGSSANGGGFNPSRTSAGSDFSLQDAAQVTYSDLVIGATNTLTSAAHPFDATHVGNLIHITGGTGFTTGWYEVISVAGITATLDRSPGTLASTSGAGKLGGAFSHPADVVAILVAGNTVYVQASGGYSFASTVTAAVDGSDVLPITWIGYTTTRTDNGQATFTSTNVAAVSMMIFSGDRQIVRNFIVAAAATSVGGFSLTGDFCVVYNCDATNGKQYGFQLLGVNCVAYRCSATGCGAGFTDDGGFRLTGANALCIQCVSYSNGANGFACWNVTGECRFCLSYSNTKSGFYQLGAGVGFVLENCTSYGNTLDGLRFDGATTLDSTWVQNCIFAANGGWGIRAINGSDYSAVTPYALKFQSNAFYANTLGLRTRVPTGATDITLTADPFVNAPSGNFALNGTEGGGLSVRAAGLPGRFGSVASPQASVGDMDVGAVQSTGITGTTDTLYDLFRELTNERNSTTIPNAQIDYYLQAGLEALNRRCRYHKTRDTAFCTLVAGTQEYDTPGDVIEVLEVEWNGRELAKSDIEAWRRREIFWRQERQGAPQEWAFYSQKIVLRPAPSAAAVADSSTLTVRYTSTPRAFPTYGPEQLSSQDWKLIVYYAIAVFSASHPDSSVALARATTYFDLFEREAAKVMVDFADRTVAR